MVLRALLLKRNDVKKFKAVTALQSHVEEREELGKLEVNIKKIKVKVREKERERDNLS